MTGKEIEEPGFDPEVVFDEGRSVGQSEVDEQLREQIAEKFIDQGFDPDEVEQLLFSEGTDIYAPRRGHRRRGGRRGGKRRCSAKQWAKMPQICRGVGGTKVRTARHPVMVYDTAPRGRYRAAATRYYRKAKGTLGKFKKYAAVGGAGLTFIGGYTKRAKDLKAMGAVDSSGKVVDGILAAIQYDLVNFDSNAAMGRLKANVGEIATPLIAGWVVKETKILGKYSGLAGDLLMGMGGGIAAKTVLDPPEKQQNSRQIQVMQPAQSVMPPVQIQPAATAFMGGNPTGGF